MTAKKNETKAPALVPDEKFNYKALYDARNEAGYLLCSVGDIGRVGIPDIDAILDKAYGLLEEGKDELKEALRILNEGGVTQ